MDKMKSLVLGKYNQFVYTDTLKPEIEDNEILLRNTEVFVNNID